MALRTFHPPWEITLVLAMYLLPIGRQLGSSSWQQKESRVAAGLGSTAQNLRSHGLKWQSSYYVPSTAHPTLRLVWEAALVSGMCNLPTGQRPGSNNWLRKASQQVVGWANTVRILRSPVQRWQCFWSRLSICRKTILKY